MRKLSAKRRRTSSWPEWYEDAPPLVRTVRPPWRLSRRPVSGQGVPAGKPGTAWAAVMLVFGVQFVGPT
jgi:hypothetical protein